MTFTLSDIIQYTGLVIALYAAHHNRATAKAAIEQATAAKAQSAIALVDSKSAHKQAEAANLQAEAANLQVMEAKQSNRIALLEKRVKITTEFHKILISFINTNPSDMNQDKDLWPFYSSLTITEFYFTKDVSDLLKGIFVDMAELYNEIDDWQAILKSQDFSKVMESNHKKIFIEETKVKLRERMYNAFDILKSEIKDDS
ncbi:MAG: hypothetical protein WC696_01435 [Candidatus Methylopumilus sp.]|jgi:hypothetical protein